MQIRCPICKKPVERRSPLSPFCSERCRLIDLGNWASERYVIQTPLPDVEEAGESARNGSRREAEGEDAERGDAERRDKG